MNKSNNNRMNQCPPSQCEVLVIGGGVAGASSLYSLFKANVKDVVLIDSGRCGVGNESGKHTSQHAFIREDDADQTRSFEHARKSGSAVMDFPTSTIKMMVNLYASSSKDFISHHGFNGARRYLKLAHTGLKIQKDLAKLAFPTNLSENLVELGSLYVCEERDEKEFREEFELLQQLGCVGVELWEKEKVQKHAGGASTQFTLGIYFPDDSVINSQQYAANLIAHILKQDEETYRLYENCAEVVKVETVNGRALTTLQNGATISSKYAVVCTGGLFTDPTLAGILSPAYSYLVSLKQPVSTLHQPNTLSYPNSTNFFTWGFTHDWCLTKGHLRCSGEDHYSALKPPRNAERCASLAKWTADKLPYLKESEFNCDKKYGVYSETPDSAPIVGTTSPQSRVCYVLGCNAWGQAALSYSGTLVAGMLGYENLSNDQVDNLKLLTIRRFALLKEVMNGSNHKLQPKL